MKVWKKNTNMISGGFTNPKNLTAWTYQHAQSEYTTLIISHVYLRIQSRMRSWKMFIHRCNLTASKVVGREIQDRTCSPSNDGVIRRWFSERFVRGGCWGSRGDCNFKSWTSEPAGTGRVHATSLLSPLLTKRVALVQNEFTSARPSITS